MSDRIEVLVKELSGLPLFEGMAPEDLRGLVRGSQVIKYAKDDPWIFREGDAADGLLILLRGEIEIVKTDTTGAEYLMSVLPAGDFLGERSLLEKGTRGAGARARTDVLVLLLSAEAYLRLEGSQPACLARLLLRMLATTSDRLRLLNEHYVLTKGCLDRLKSFT